MEYCRGDTFLRQMSDGSSPSCYTNSSSAKGGGSSSSASSSRRWGSSRRRGMSSEECCGGDGMRGQMGGLSLKKRVMVVVDQSTRAKHAMMWALTHIANKGDLLTLLHVLPPPRRNQHGRDEYAPNLANSLGSLCEACKPEVEVEALVIQGAKLATVLSQVKKLEASVLVLSQANPTAFSCLFRSSSEEFVEQCINKAECLTMAVRKQSNGMGGYLVSTRWQKNFWLLA